jgi:hypothetical protein
MTHGPVPEQPPPEKPAKLDPASGTAVRVTVLPPVNAAAQAEPHTIPPGVLVTVPEPVPAFESVSAG